VGQRRSDQPAQPARDFKAYKRIDWRTLQTAARAWSGGWSSGDRGLRLFMAGAESSAVYIGDGPFPLHGPGEGHDPARRVPFVMVRRKGASTDYNAVLVPFRGASAVQTVEWPGPGLTRVELADGRECRVCLAGESARGEPEYSCTTYKDGKLVGSDALSASEAGGN